MPAKHGGKASKNAITLAAPQLFPDHHLLVGVDAVYLKDVLGKIQTDRANLHVDGSLMCFVIDHPMALRCRERVPSTTSEAGDFAREPANACGQTCLLEVAEENSGGTRWLAQSESMPISQEFDAAADIGIGLKIHFHFLMPPSKCRCHRRVG